MSNGKGDAPRNCFSEKFRKNFDEIDWSESPKKSECPNCKGTGVKDLVTFFECDGTGKKLL
jgi:DnaJ-class molecular chaperone